MRKHVTEITALYQRLQTELKVESLHVKLLCQLGFEHLDQEDEEVSYSPEFMLPVTAGLENMTDVCLYCPEQARLCMYISVQQNLLSILNSHTAH